MGWNFQESYSSGCQIYSDDKKIDLDPKCYASSYFKAEKSNKNEKKEKNPNNFPKTCTIKIFCLFSIGTHPTNIKGALT